MKIAEIQDLIKFIAKAGVTEVEIEQKDFKITIKSEMPQRKKGFEEPQVHHTHIAPVTSVPMQIQAAPLHIEAPAEAPAESPAEAPAAKAVVACAVFPLSSC